MAKQRPHRHIRQAIKAMREAIAAEEAAKVERIRKAQGVVSVRGMFAAFENPRRATGKEAGAQWGYNGHKARVIHRQPLRSL